MKRLLFLAFLVFAAWYGWRHYKDLTSHRPSHDAVIENHSGRVMERIRLTVGGQTFVKESLADETSVTFPFRVDADATFQLEWKWAGTDIEQRWAGGFVPRGPMVQTHHFTVDPEGNIVFQAENKGGP